MAIARLIAPFASLSGKVAAPDTQAAASAVVAMPESNGRTLLRSFVQPANPDTAAQTEVRAILTNITEAYQSLTQPQVEAWQAIAQEITNTGRLGLDYTLSWTMLFNRINSYRQLNGQAIVLDPPAQVGANVPTGVGTVNSDDGDPAQSLQIGIQESAAPTAGSFLVFRLTRNLGSPVRQARVNELRYITSSPAGSFKPRDTTNPYIYSLASTRLNVFSDTNIGVEVLVLDAAYYPVGRLFAKNVVVDQP
jgi:hypothetical protein